MLFYFTTITASCKPTKVKLLQNSKHFPEKLTFLEIKVMSWCIMVLTALSFRLWYLPSAVLWWLITHVHMRVVIVMSGEPIRWWSRPAVWWQASCRWWWYSVLNPSASSLWCSQSNDGAAMLLRLKLQLRALNGWTFSFDFLLSILISQNFGAKAHLWPWGFLRISD